MPPRGLENSVLLSDAEEPPPMEDTTQAIHQKALEAAARFKRAEADLISILQEVEGSRVFMKLGYTSLFAYSVEALGLSESVAANFVTVSRKAKEVPALQSAIQKGLLSVSKARKITPVLTTENQGEWVAKAQALSTRKLEQEVAKIAPQAAVPERMKFVAEDRLELRVGISKVLQEKLKRAQDLESQRTGRAVSLEETLEALAAVYLEKKDPLQRAHRAAERNGVHVAGACVTGQVSETKPSVNREAIPAAILHQVRRRDEGRCVHQDAGGRRCESRRWIHIHHVQPRGKGGPNTVENLITLCSAHHRMEHGGTEQEGEIAGTNYN
jgi:hypothetical protein